MSQNNAPWLDGLDGTSTWTSKPVALQARKISSASHNASSLLGKKPGQARRSCSSNSVNTMRKGRSPLAPIDMNDSNNRGSGPNEQSFENDKNLENEAAKEMCGTVQLRSQSSSPTKKQASLEWRKRLLDGKLGYGDQTDLFGPSALENIFAQSGRSSDRASKPVNKRLGWMPKSDISIPSSPPPWSGPAISSLKSSQGGKIGRPTPSPSLCGSSRPQADDRSSTSEHEREGSLASNPFDLRASDSIKNDDENPLNEDDDENSLNDNDDSKLDVHAVANRTLGGPTELEQEDFSPVFISKHTTVNGKVDYAAVDSHTIKQFGQRSLALRLSEQSDVEFAEQDEDPRPEASLYIEQSVFTDGPQSESNLAPVHDLSLSENLPTGTPEPLGQFVQLERGGYSTRGSFRHRLLSAEIPAADEVSKHQTSDLPLPEHASSSQPPPHATSPPVTSRAPHTPQSKNRTTPKSSPLKLFGPHDTFTSNRLLRRMSQLDQEPQAADDATPDPVNPSPRPDEQAVYGSLVEEHSRQTSFGAGELDGHRFTANITITTASSSDQDEIDDRSSPASDIPVPGSKIPMNFRVDSSPTSNASFRLPRKGSSPVALPTDEAPSSVRTQEARFQPSVEEVPFAEEPQDATGFQSVVRKYSENKRPPTSPVKDDPTPKRRRTLHALEMSEGTANDGASDPFEADTNRVCGENARKRKDALPGVPRFTATQELLAERRMMRPRNPTPSNRLASGESLAPEIKDAADEFLAQEDRSKVEEVLDHVEQSITEVGSATFKERAEAVAGEVARFTLKIDKAGDRDSQGERKRSVTTQDFFREAECVMEYIRARAAKKLSLLSSVAEAEVPEEEELDDPSHLSVADAPRSLGHLRISREPSWEGRPRSRWREPEQLRVQRDEVNMNRVASQLRKWTEAEDEQEAEFIAESTLARVDLDDQEPDSVEGDFAKSEVVFDEHANIRITHPSAEQVHQAADDMATRPNSQRSVPSTAGSTKRSDNVGTLAPNAVAHLIGLEVGGMAFDKETKKWVRLRSSEHRAGRDGFLDVHNSHLTSEDDPFREISDLKVDEGIEQRRISSPARLPDPSRPVSAEEHVDTHTKPDLNPTVDSRTSSQETVLGPRHQITTEEPHVQNRVSHRHSSSVPSKNTFLTSLQQDEIETRATSWATEEFTKLRGLHLMPQPQLTNEEADESVRSSEASALIVDRELPPTPPLTQTLDNEATQASVEPELSYRLREDTALGDDASEMSEIHSSRLRQSVKRSAPKHFRAQNGTQELPMRTKSNASYNHYEQSEISFVAPLPGDRMMSLSLSVSKPVLPRHSQVGRILDPYSSPLKGNSSFLLSDLPDFTVNEVDEERPSERALATRLVQHASAEIGDRYALARTELVKALTDVYTEEPYWEDIQDLNLDNQALTTLHGLSDFCDGARSLDVSTNSLTQLEGAPSSVRCLKATSNKLSDVTSFAHLPNLQYLDVSGNGLQNVAGLANLVHLREIKADNNQIESIDGVAGLDGLLKLRCRGNKIVDLNIGLGELDRLVELDLTDNVVKAINGLERLQALESLRLDRNQLTNGFSILRTMPKLKHLSLRNCGLTHLDVSHMPGLETLDLDDNSLVTIQGLSTLKRLQVLSMRRQSLPEGKTVDIFGEQIEAHTVHLSGNTMPSLDMRGEWLSLKHLELAAVGLQDLPQDFGLLVPNLRTLNLNFNSLKDIRPLLNINGLEQLQVCGNRLHRLRKSSGTLAKMPGLKTVDLRDNPITQGFYSSVSAAKTNQITTLARRGLANEESDGDEDEQSASMEAARYSLPQQDTSGDDAHFARLDEETKLRRRVYEMLLAHSCKTLQKFDGLALKRKRILVKDGVWERLVELGIVRRSGGAS